MKFRPATGRQLKLLDVLANEGGYPAVSDLLRRFGTNPGNLTKQEADRVITALYLRPRVPPYIAE